MIDASFNPESRTHSWWSRIPLPARLFLLAFAVCLPTVVYTWDLPTDAANYYAPMAREMAAGNWKNGFFPMIPPLIPLLAAGMSTVLRVDPYTALKIVSALFFALTVFPAYALMRDVWGKRPALWGTMLMLFCSRLIRYGGAGLLDSAKMFFLVLLVYALMRTWREGPAWFSTMLIAVAAAGLTLARGDGVFFAAVGGVALLGLEVQHNIRRKDKPVWRTIEHSAACAAAIFVLLIPQLLYQMQTMGYPVTDSRQLEVAFVKPFFHRLGYEPPLVSMMEQEPFPWPFAKQKVTNMISEAVKGLHPRYLLFAVPILLLRLYRRRLRRAEVILLGVALGHTLFFVGLTFAGWFVAKRYISAVIPLLCGWTALGLIAVYDSARNRLGIRGQRVLAAVLVLAALASVWNGNSRARPSMSPRKQLKREMTIDQARWLAQEGVKRVPPSFSGLVSTTASYHNGRKPVVMSGESNLIYLAKADNVLPPIIDTQAGHYTYPPGTKDTFELEWLLERCETKSVHYVAVDPIFARAMPFLADLAALPAELTIAYDRWREHGRVILAYEPNLLPAEQPQQ